MIDDHVAAGRLSHGGAPPVAAAAQVLFRLADLVRTSLNAQASVAKQSVDLAWATLAGDLDRVSAHKAYVASVTREGARYWRTVGELGVDYATDLVTLGRSVSTTVLREAAAAGRKTGSRLRAEASANAESSTSMHLLPEESGRLGTVSLRGSVGQRAEGMITVANQHSRRRRIQLGASELVDSRGAGVGAFLDLSPATVIVPGGQERSVEIGVTLDASSFSAGKQYSCTVDVSGGDEATIEVSIQVRS